MSIHKSFVNQLSRFQSVLRYTAVLILALIVWIHPPGISASGSAAYAYNNPDLLPETQTPVIDLAKALNSEQEEALVKDLESFEKETGWKLRVLTQFERTPGTAVKDFWGLDDRSVLLVADPRGGNLLNFNVGDGALPAVAQNILD